MRLVTWNGAQPHLDESLGTSDGRRTWRATIDGRPALVMEFEAPTESAAAQIAERLRRLSNHPDASLRPLLGWAREGSTVSVATDGEDGPSLEELLRGGPLTPDEAAAVGWAVLTALQVLHEAGLAHGALDSSQVRVSRDGRIQIGGHWFNAARRATSDDLLADVEAAGAVASAALGISTHPEPGAGPTPAERDAPALTRTVRAIASGASGANVSGARMALSATAGSLVQPSGLTRTARLLAARVRGEAIPPAATTPPPPAPARATAATRAPTPPPPQPPPEPEPDPGAAALPAPPISATRGGAIVHPEEPARPAAAVANQRWVATPDEMLELDRPGGRGLGVPLMVVGGILVALFLLWAALTVVRGITSRPTAATPPSHAAAPATAASTPRPSAASTPAPTPAPTTSGPPSFGPASAGPVQSVSLSAGGCTPGAQCSVEVTVKTTTASSATSVEWTIKAYDACAGKTVDVGQNKVTEQGGWNTVIGDNSITVPSSKSVQLVAVTSSPATAASAPTILGGGAC